MSIKRERLSADAFLACMAFDFPGLFYDGVEVSGADLVEWISINQHHLKKNVLANCQREATIRLSEGVGAK